MHSTPPQKNSTLLFKMNKNERSSEIRVRKNKKVIKKIIINK